MIEEQLRIAQAAIEKAQAELKDQKFKDITFPFNSIIKDIVSLTSSSYESILTNRILDLVNLLKKQGSLPNSFQLK
jgi:hypothetical protein